MNKISLRKILILLLVILLLSRTGKILQLFSGLDFNGILTLEPLRDSPQEGRFLVTLGLFALAFITMFVLLNRRK